MIVNLLMNKDDNKIRMFDNRVSKLQMLLFIKNWPTCLTAHYLMIKHEFRFHVIGIFISRRERLQFITNALIFNGSKAMEKWSRASLCIWPDHIADYWTDGKRRTVCKIVKSIANLKINLVLFGFEDWVKIIDFYDLMIILINQKDSLSGNYGNRYSDRLMLQFK